MAEKTHLEAAVERAARALSVWWSGAFIERGSIMRLGGEWSVWMDGRSHRVAAPTAAAWLLALHAGGEVDVGPCEDCEGLGRHHWARLEPDAGWPDSKREGWAPGGGPSWCGHRPCPKCSKDHPMHVGTGRDLRPLALAVLDAAGGEPSENAPAVEAVGRWQTQHGTATSLAEALTRVWESLTVECPNPRCDGGDLEELAWPEDYSGPDDTGPWPCTRCAGSGRVPREQP